MQTIVRSAAASIAVLLLTTAAFAQSPAKIRIVLVGDSTVTDESGWGRGFREFVSPAVDVVNTAAGGRSSKSFIDEGRWAAALKSSVAPETTRPILGSSRP